MHRNTRQEMVKASIWMHKNEMKKIEELSGDISKNLFMMRAIRKAIKEGQGGNKEGQGGNREE